MTETKEMIGTTEAGRILGMSKHWVLSHIKELPHIRYNGGEYRFVRSEIEDFRDDHYVVPKKFRA